MTETLNELRHGHLVAELLTGAPPPEVLAKRTVQLIDGEIEGRRWNQKEWLDESGSCGSVCCVAGNVAIDLGVPDGVVGGVHVGYEFLAGRALGLSPADAHWLVDVDRSESQVRWALDRIIDGDGVSFRDRCPHGGRDDWDPSDVPT